MIEKFALVLIDYTQHPEKLRAALEQVAKVLKSLGNWILEYLESLLKDVFRTVIDMWNNFGKSIYETIKSVETIWKVKVEKSQF